MSMLDSPESTFYMNPLALSKSPAHISTNHPSIAIDLCANIRYTMWMIHIFDTLCSMGNTKYHYQSTLEDTRHIYPPRGQCALLSMFNNLNHRKLRNLGDMSHMLVLLSRPFHQVGTSCNQSKVSSQIQNHIRSIFSWCNSSNYQSMVGSCLLG